MAKLFNKGTFRCIMYLQVAFSGQKFRGVHHFLGNPYLNSTTILFDIEYFLM